MIRKPPPGSLTNRIKKPPRKFEVLNLKFCKSEDHYIFGIFEDQKVIDCTHTLIFKSDIFEPRRPGTLLGNPQSLNLGTPQCYV